MNEMAYTLLTEVYGRFDAETLKSFLTAEGIDVELIQEGIGNSIYPMTVGELARVQVFVPNEKLEAAKQLLAVFENGELNIEIAETDDFEENDIEEETENEE